jgi:serine/threonine protein phosphatase 1
MAGRTFAIGDIHGELAQLDRVLEQLPALDAGDTLVFLGDYLDRGPDSKAVIERLMALPRATPAKVVCLRGNHEDAWLRVRREGWDEFVLPPEHGCYPTLYSFLGTPLFRGKRKPSHADTALLASGDFLPAEVVTWMEALPFWYEDGHGIYVHAGLPKGPQGFLHPTEVHAHSQAALAWVRTDDFTRNYRGKRVTFGHTPVSLLPPELSTYTPDDRTDMWESEHIIGLDTGCGREGFLSAIELPLMQVYESRQASPAAGGR